MKNQNDKQHSVTKKNKRNVVLAGKQKYYFPLLFILIISFIAYLPIFQNGFLNWDDDKYVTNNPIIYNINLKEIFSHYVWGNYHPLTILFYAIQYKFFVLNAAGYHAINLLLHLLNTILVFYFVFHLTDGKAEVALLASLLFGIHPLHVESVAWASELKDLLYVFFFLASCICYLLFLKNNKRSFYFYSLLLFLASLLSKAMAASLPVVLLLIDHFKGRLNLKTGMGKIPFFALALIFGIVAVFAQHSLNAIDISLFSFPQRLVFACYGFITYLFKLFLPFQLSAYYPYPIGEGESIPLSFYLYIPLFLALAGAVYYSLRFSNKLFFGIMFFFVTVFLVLQLLPVGEAMIADRYSYLPSIGIFYLAGEGFYWLWNKKGLSFNPKSFLKILLVAVVILFSAKTYSRCQTWKNPLTFWNDIIDQYQTIPDAYYNRGCYFLDQKKNDLALQDFNQAIKMQPKFAKAYGNRSKVLMSQKRYEEAIADCNKSIELQPDMPEVYNNRGAIFMDLNKPEEALQDFGKALALRPNYIDALVNQGILFSNQNKVAESLSNYNKAIEMDPGHFKAYFNRAFLFLKDKKYDQALSDYNKAIELQPGFAQAYADRGNLLLSQGLTQEAISSYSKAIELQPDLAISYYNRAIALYDSGKKEAACADLQQAASLRFQQAEDLFNKICR